MNLDVLEKYRLTNDPTGMWNSKPGDQFGFFFIPSNKAKLAGPKLKVMCAPMDRKSGWQHVSVSMPNRCPTWNEMCLVKDLFWGDDVTVVQFHPKKSNYVNIHKYCLHLWCKVGEEYELPPELLV
jgi:hypothetical protein